MVTRWNPATHNLFWKMRTKGDPRFTAETQQPLLAQTALMLLHTQPEKESMERLRAWTEAAQTNIDWLVRNRRAEGRKLLSIIDPVESGEDSLPAWDLIAAEKGWWFLPQSVRVFWISLTLNLHYWRLSWNLRKIYESSNSVLIEPVSLNVFVVRELLALEVLWQLLGRRSQSNLDRLLAEELEQAISTELWNEKAGAYFPQARFRDGWRQMPIYSVESLYPLLLPKHPTQRIARLVQLIEMQFVPRAKYLLPVAPVDPKHPQQVLGQVPIWWPGQIWANCNWFFRDALSFRANRLKGSLAKSALELATRIDRDWSTLKEKVGYPEFYFQDGGGGGEKQFFWNCLRRAKFPVEIK